MKKSPLLPLLACAALLPACSRSDSAPVAQTSASTTPADPLQANFQEYLGSYRIVACKASLDPEQYCQAQTAQVKVEPMDGDESLVVEEDYHSDDGNQTGKLQEGVSVLGNAKVSCQLSPGKSVCQAANLADHPGVSLTVEFHREGNAVKYREESVDAEHAENNLVLELTLAPN